MNIAKIHQRFRYIETPAIWTRSLSLLHLQLQIPILQNRTRLSGQQRALGRRVLGLERVADLLHRHPLDALELVDVLDVAAGSSSAEENGQREVAQLTALASSNREGAHTRQGGR